MAGTGGDCGSEALRSRLFFSGRAVEGKNKGVAWGEVYKGNPEMFRMNTEHLD